MRRCSIVVTADRPVKSHNGGNRTVNLLCRFFLAALFIGVICALIVWHFNEARTFLQGAGITYALWSVVNWYDALVIDCIWFCHSKRFRIPGTENMEKDYLDYGFHIRGSMKGQLIGLPVALLVGGFVALFALV